MSFENIKGHPAEETRRRVRQIVSDILGNAARSAAPVPPPATPGTEPKHVLVNSLRERAEREFDRDESAKALITEFDLRGLDEGARLRVAETAKFTPLADDIVRERRLVLIRKKERGEPIKAKTVAVGADHGGFPYKEKLRTFLQTLGLTVIDLGTDSTDAVDYPDHAHAVARAVADRQAELGIIIDGAGIGSAMAANKVPGVRAAACYSVELANNARQHNGANVLTLGSGQNSFEQIKAITEAFLTAELTEDRHRRRVEKIDTIQQRYAK